MFSFHICYYYLDNIIWIQNLSLALSFYIKDLVSSCELLYFIVMRKTFSPCLLINKQENHKSFGNGVYFITSKNAKILVMSGYREKNYKSLAVSSSLPGKCRLFSQQSGQHLSTFSCTVTLFWKLCLCG